MPHGYEPGDRVFLTTNLFRSNANLTIERESIGKYPHALKMGTCGTVLDVHGEELRLRFWVDSEGKPAVLDDERTVTVRLPISLCGALLEPERRFGDRDETSAKNRAIYRMIGHVANHRGARRPLFGWGNTPR